MAQPRQTVEHVSDTAKWVAVYRAMETERPDALFNDPYARKLAGEQGEAIFRKLPAGDLTAWPIVVRTVVFDEMILKAVREEGVDLVLNLAAGLDTRPYRLALPATLRWVEIDLPGIIEHKERILQGEQPRCQLERVVCDLADVDARRAAFSRVTAGARKVFVLTEGLVMYLTDTQVASLASDLASTAHVRLWAMDLMGPWLRMGMNFAFRHLVGTGDVSFHFAPREGPGFFTPFGWWVRQHIGTDEESIRLNRLPFLAGIMRVTRRFTPEWRRKQTRDWSCFALLERDAR